jgi:signal transduction histidine kinase
MRALTRIGLAATAVVSLVAGALFVTVWNYRDAVNAREAAVTAMAAIAETRAAEGALAREHESTNLVLFHANAEAAAAVNRFAHQFGAALHARGFEEPREHALVQQALVANLRLLRIAFTSKQSTSVASFRRTDRRIDAAEEAAFAPLQRLRTLNVIEQRDVEKDARSASKRALVSAIAAGVIAVLGGLAFALYATVLVRDIGTRNRRLRRLDRMKDDFVASVSHELRTPLTSIRGYLDLVLDGEAGELNEEQERFLRVVERNADRILRVVGDLLFVAQADAGKISLDTEPVDIGEVAAEAAEALGPAAADKEIELAVELDDVGELDADRARLAQVLDNLVSNAVKFTPAGGRVAVRTVRHGDSVIVEVADTGMGMSHEEVEQVFTRFFRTRGATDGAIQGTGLGLGIAKAIVSAHGGEISVESAVGRGTTFRVELPLSPERVAA